MIKGTTQIVAIVGMPGSGKSEVAQLFGEKGFARIRLGDETERGLAEKGLPATEANERAYREELRAKYGMAAYAKAALPKIHEAIKTNEKIVLDGLYSWEEYLFLREKFENLTIVGVIVSARVRHERLGKRLQRPLTRQEAVKRDIDEIDKLNKGGPIAVADYYIENDGSKEELSAKIEALLQKLNLA